MDPRLREDRAGVAGGRDLLWIHAFTVEQHFEVKMRRGRAARASDATNCLPSSDRIARLDGRRRQMGVARLDPVRVFDHHHQPVRAALARERHLARRRGRHLGPVGRRGGRHRCETCGGRGTDRCASRTRTTCRSRAASRVRVSSRPARPRHAPRRHDRRRRARAPSPERPSTGRRLPCWRLRLPVRCRRRPFPWTERPDAPRRTRAARAGRAPSPPRRLGARSPPSRPPCPCPTSRSAARSSC